jgi:hypothetical protein
MPSPTQDYLPPVIQPGKNTQRNRLSLKLFVHKLLEYCVGKITFPATVFDAEKKKFAGIPIKGQSNGFLFCHNTPITIQGFCGLATNLQKRVELSERFRD